MWSVFFVFLSYLDRNFVRGDFLSAEKESKEALFLLNFTQCVKVSTGADGFLLYQVSDGSEVVSSTVSTTGKLLGCSVVASPPEVKSFTHECSTQATEQRARHELDARYARMDEAKATCREFERRSSREPGRPEVVLRRSKRGFTYPGTLWCGAGNMADHYDQLGALNSLQSRDVSRECVYVCVLPNYLPSTVLQASSQRPTAAAASTTTVRLSSTPSPLSTATPTSSGTPSPTATATRGDDEF